MILERFVWCFQICSEHKPVVKVKTYLTIFTIAVKKITMFSQYFLKIILQIDPTKQKVWYKDQQVVFHMALF